jgi:hypothetical protein
MPMPQLNQSNVQDHLDLETASIVLRGASEDRGKTNPALLHA